MSEPTARPTRYEVGLLPEDDINAHVFALAVEYRGHGLWAVLRFSQCLGTDGEWSYESNPSSRTDNWLARHRFPLEEALALAKEHAPNVTVNGMTVADVLARKAARG
jgi:hypothetical protein